MNPGHGTRQAESRTFTMKLERLAALTILPASQVTVGVDFDVIRSLLLRRLLKPQRE